MRILFIISALFFSSCSSQVENDNSENALGKEVVNELKFSNSELYEYKTFKIYEYGKPLIGNYTVNIETYTADDGSDWDKLTLTKNNKIIKQLNQGSSGGADTQLGYIGGDFRNHLLFIQAFNGDPTICRILNKQDGENIAKGTYVDVNETEGIILFFDFQGNLLYFDTNESITKQINGFEDLNCNINNPQRCCIKIQSVTKDQIVISMNSSKGIITKEYSR